MHRPAKLRGMHRLVGFVNSGAEKGCEKANRRNEQTFYGAKTQTHAILNSSNRVFKEINRVRSAICTFILALALCPFFAEKAHAAGIVYVNINTSGPVQDGTSWATAFKSLQVALTSTPPGNQIWVAKGSYSPTAVGDPTASFLLVNGVAVYGGFAGIEPPT